MALKAEKLAEDDLDLEPGELAELEAAIDEADAEIAAGVPGFTPEESLERVRAILFG